MAKKAATATKKKAMSKSEIMAAIAESTNLSKKDVSNVLDEFASLITKNLKKGPGIFAFPGMAKFKVVRKPATKARRGINPFTGLEQDFPAKPAKNVVKIVALKALKDACM